MRGMKRFAPMLAVMLLTACGPDDDHPEVVPQPGHTGADGDFCSSGTSCDGGACFLPVFGYQGGYCTTPNCQASSDCHGENSVCLEFIDGTSNCFAGCSESEDCRDGYDCLDRTGTSGASVCLPTTIDLPQATFAPPVTFEESLSVLGADCSPEPLSSDGERPTWRFRFSVGMDAASFVIAPLVKEGTVRPISMQTPNELVDFGQYRHHNTRFEDLLNPPRSDFGTYGEVAFDWPVMVPYAPQFEHLVVPGGEYELEVQTDGDEPCLYVIEGGLGSVIDLDIHLVGAGGLDAASAPTDPNITEALEAAEGHLAEAGLSFGEVRFLNAEPEVAERFSIVRDLNEVDLLTATGAPRGSGRDDHLTVDVFLVDSILFNGVTALGISASLPGSPGLHGNGANGLVFGTPDLGVDNAIVGQILAHELGHYLGLRHTTETVHGIGGEGEAQFEATVGSTDPIEDTEYCESVSRLGSRCPDYHNLMFPTLQNPGDDITPILTESQRAVLRLSPLVKRGAEQPM